MPEPLKLKYLFIAEYEDGSTHEQTPEDKSKIEPDKRSEYFDVLQSGKKVIRFSLVGDGNRLTVDLLDGTFTLNGVRFLAESIKLPIKPEFELLFYRQHTHDFNAQYQGEVQKSIKETDHFVEYFIGWKCNISGKEYAQKIALA